MEVILVIVTFFATVLGAISGIGGGVIIKPVMDALCDYPVATISFLSGNTVLAMTAVSLLRSRKDTIKIDTVVGLPLALGGALGGVVGKILFTIVKQNTHHDARIGMIQNIIMVILTATVFVYVLNKHKIKTLHMTNKAGSLLAGLALGIFSSFLGIGGGPINIMVLSYLFSMDSKHAAINSLYIIFFSQVANLLTNIIQGAIPPFSYLLLSLMMASGIIGAMAGRSASAKLDNRQIDKLFMLIMLVIVALSAYNVFGYASLV
ncbi:MAG TPA: sulfite exporter TauE/SafE family protein [Sphaerochaeta sp.]|nr:sulfite exporter TauE/SafE family protein [Sphaerochaeta sp.]